MRYYCTLSARSLSVVVCSGRAPAGTGTTVLDRVCVYITFLFRTQTYRQRIWQVCAHQTDHDLDSLDHLQWLILCLPSWHVVQDLISYRSIQETWARSSTSYGSYLAAMIYTPCRSYKSGIYLPWKTYIYMSSRFLMKYITTPAILKFQNVTFSKKKITLFCHGFWHLFF